MTVLSFAEFQATKKAQNDSEVISKAFPDHKDELVSYYVYDDWLLIAELPNKKFKLEAMRGGKESFEITSLEERLWAGTHLFSVNAPDPSDIYLGDDQNDLDSFIRGYCDMMNVECDGDELGAIFSDIDHGKFTLEECSKRLEEYAERVRNEEPEDDTPRDYFVVSGFNNVTRDLQCSIGSMAILDSKSDAEAKRLEAFRIRLIQLTRDWKEFVGE